MAAFDVGTLREDGTRDNKHISHGDVAGVALAAIQELHKRNDNLTARNQRLESQMAELRVMVEALMANK